MNPHIVLNFNLSADTAQGGGALQSSAATATLPTPLTAGGISDAGAAARALDTASSLPSPLSAVTGAALASFADGRLPTPFDLEQGASAASSDGRLPTPLDLLAVSRSAGSRGTPGSGLPVPTDWPSQSLTASGGQEDQMPSPLDLPASSGGGQGAEAPQPAQTREDAATPERGAARGKK